LRKPPPPLARSPQHLLLRQPQKRRPFRQRSMPRPRHNQKVISNLPFRQQLRIQHRQLLLPHRRVRFSQEWQWVQQNL
jgi:hypothetical protein